MSVRVVGSFERRWTVFWATTYTFGLPFFESFLLPRLGDPPLNATILVDAHRLADAYQHLAGDTPWRGARANRDYLVRGVAPTAGAFHPKTYFFGNERAGVLYVGSGNLTMDGLETGKEVFVRFDSRDETDIGAIRAWRAWMDELVTAARDPAVDLRWRDARLRAPWLNGPVTPSAFVDNWRRPLLDSALDGVETPVDELFVTAPFYDQHADALKEVINRSHPRRIDILVGRDASVDGPALMRVLGASGANVVTHGLDPDTYVHGKLLGLINGRHGRIFCGSANLSQGALLKAAARDADANVECGAIADVDPAVVREAFVPPPPPVGLRVVDRDAATLHTLRFLPSAERRFAIQLRSASWLPDSRIRVDAGDVSVDGLQLADWSTAVDIAGDATVNPMTDETTRLVWIVDRSGGQCSNKVALDLPTFLQRALSEGAEGPEDRPAGIEAADLETPVGQMLARLHEACIFDFDETPTARRIARAADLESEDPDFWERLAREELRQDPRVARYLQLGTGAPVLDGVFLDIARMLEVVPGLSSIHVVSREHDGTEPTRTGVSWTPDRRLQIRLFNLLERWCTALSDPRLQWISLLTPVANFAALLGALRECWTQGYLPEHRVIRLVGVILTSFVRAERRPGFLARLDLNERAEALATLGESAAPSVAGGLVYAAVRPSQKDLLAYLFAWQPALVDALDWNIMRFDDASVAITREVSGQTVEPDAAAGRVAWASTYIDDARWSEVISRETGLAVALTVRGFAARFGATLSVGTEVALLEDARVVEVVRRALAYRHTDACVVESGPDRMSIRIGDLLAARIDGKTVESDEVVTADRLEALAATGAGFSDLMWASEAAS